METLQYPKETKAKKEHRCDFCTGAIRKGETYNKSTHKYDGEVYDWKTHLRCHKLAHKMDMYSQVEMYEGGVTQEYFMESVSDFHDDLMINLLPKEGIHSDIIQQLRHVHFHYKLRYVLRYYAKLENQTKTD